MKTYNSSGASFAEHSSQTLLTPRHSWRPMYKVQREIWRSGQPLGTHNLKDSLSAKFPTSYFNRCSECCCWVGNAGTLGSLLYTILTMSSSRWKCIISWSFRCDCCFASLCCSGYDTTISGRASSNLVVPIPPVLNFDNASEAWLFISDLSTDSN